MSKRKDKDPRIQMAEDERPSFVPPIVAAIASAIIPGLGQFLSRSFRKGLVLLFSFVTIIGLLVWRFKLAAPRDDAWKDIIPKAFHLEPLMMWVTILVGILYLWIIVDAYFSAKKPGGIPTGVTFRIAGCFLRDWLANWRDRLVAFTTQADDAIPALSRVFWPWKRAITYPETLLVGTGEVMSPCTDEEFPETTPLKGEPYIVISPTCGNTSEQSGAAGTILTLNGYRICT